MTHNILKKAQMFGRDWGKSTLECGAEVSMNSIGSGSQMTMSKKRISGV